MSVKNHRINDLDTPYTVIDADPHFKRVVGYFRPSDYVWWAGATAAGPLAFWSLHQATPTPVSKSAGLRTPLRLSGWIGFIAGFLFAYQNSALRFQGWKENALEAKRDKEEMTALVKAGKPIYGESDLPEYIQGVAHRNSLWSVTKLGLLPWFNVVNHKYHGADETKYKSDDE